MGNVYVSQYKEALKGFHNRMRAYQAEIDDNNKRFSVEYAKKANEDVENRARTDYESTKAKINDTYSTVRSLLGRGMFLSAESLTADRMFFESNSGFDLTPDDVNGFIERYSGNTTMTRLIRDWVERKKTEGTSAGGVSDFSNCKTILPEDQLEVYKKFGNSALSILDTIYSSPNDMIKAFVDSFANEDFGAPLFAIIGDGLNLNDYKNRRIPEYMTHYFDSITLQA